MNSYGVLREALQGRFDPVHAVIIGRILAHTLRWRPGDAIDIDLRLPAHGVTFQAQRFLSVARPTDRLFSVRGQRVDRSGRHWIIRVPARAARVTDLLIFASFANGNLFTELGLRRVQAR